MKPFGWATRLQYAALAGLAGWGSGIVLTAPFEFGVAQRYVAGNAKLLPVSFVEGMLIWCVFTLFMALAAWLPLVLPTVLLIPPRWLVRFRWLLVPGSLFGAAIAISRRLQVLKPENFTDWPTFKQMFFVAPIVFAVTFASVMTGVYLMLAARRLGARRCQEDL